MAMTDSFRAEHDELVTMVGVLRETIALPEPPDSLELFKFRQGFTKKLVAHLTKEDWVLYPALLNSKDANIVATAQAFADEMGGLLDVFKAWSARWPIDAIGVDWEGFRADTTTLIDALARRIERENSQLYPLVEGDFARAA